MAESPSRSDCGTPDWSHQTAESFRSSSNKFTVGQTYQPEQPRSPSREEAFSNSDDHLCPTEISDEVALTEAETLDLALQAHSPLWSNSPSSSDDSLRQAVLVTEEERNIFDYYLRTPGAWLDIVSVDNCFAQVVPGQAVHTPVLYSACVAYAAQHMFLSGILPLEKATRCHSEAINQLVPLLNPARQSIPTDILLATTVLLRMSEQFSEPDQDARCHINGTFALVVRQASKWSPNRVDIEGVCFWVFVRQSLRIAFLFGKPCGVDLNIVDDTDMLSSARDDVWTNRITLLLAKVVSVCCEPARNGATTCDELRDLESRVIAWSSTIPQTFQPWFYRQVPSEAFPTIRYLNRWHGEIAHCLSPHSANAHSTEQLSAGSTTILPGPC